MKSTQSMIIFAACLTVLASSVLALEDCACARTFCLQGYVCGCASGRGNDCVPDAPPASAPTTNHGKTPGTEVRSATHCYCD